MKIQIDSEAKTIKIEDAVNFGELLSILENAFPDFKEYKIIPIVTVTQNPVFGPFPDPNPFWPPQVLYFNEPPNAKPTIVPCKPPFEITCKVN